MALKSDFIAQICNNPLYKTIGLMVESADNGSARLRLSPNPDVCWPHIGPHGGILFTAIDTTSAWAVMSLLEPGHDCTTIDMNIHYARQAKGESFICNAEVTHQAGRTCFVRAELLDEDSELVCLGQGAFRIISNQNSTIPGK